MRTRLTNVKNMCFEKSKNKREGLQVEEDITRAVVTKQDVLVSKERMAF